MDDEPLAQTFVSYWTTAQTIATQSRFWLENAIFQIILDHSTRTRRLKGIYTSSMLAKGCLNMNQSIAELRELQREYRTNRSPWMEPVQTSVLQVADQIISEQERKWEKKENGRR